ncbi:GNAT family N-acetyltransferase [Bacillus altitudinis]|uniref:GNAT family N-acetyltransferase n=1 Tax=Bacillus altitudinis TaxID=293387 RepID=UPI001C22DA68|nr:GNAT family protein [Bacillus altitudinis]MBU8967403.1 GNAT family N-acetyltransferase [Bacillus altitudinis]
MKGKKEEIVSIRPLDETDLEVVWHLRFKAPDQAYRKWNAPYFIEHDISLAAFKKRYLQDDSVLPKLFGIDVGGELKGTVSYYWENERTRWLECGILIYDSRFWNGGVGTKALRLWIDELFSHIDIPRIGLTTWSGNERMMRCAEKCGFILEGRLRKVRYYQGAYYDSMRYGMLREEWQSLPNHSFE